MAWILTVKNRPVQLREYTMGVLAHIQSRCLISYDSIASRRIESKGSKWPRWFYRDSTLLPLSSMCSSQSNTPRWLLTTQSHFSCIKKQWVLRDIAYSLWLLIRLQLLPASCGISKPKLLKFAKLYNCCGISCSVSCPHFLSHYSHILQKILIWKCPGKPSKPLCIFCNFHILERALTESFLTPIVQVYWMYCSSGLDSYFTCISVKNVFDGFSW